MPQELICPERRQAAWRDYEPTAPGPAEVRLQAEFGAEKHGTMMAFFKGYALDRGWYDTELSLYREGESNPYPVGLGNMLVGRVIECGTECVRLKAGDRVCVYSNFKPALNYGEPGCWKLPDNVDWRDAVCLDPAVFAMGAVRDGNIRLGDCVAVFGLGVIGLMLVQLLKLAGVSKLIAVDPIPRRRELALQLGADWALDPLEGETALRIRRDHTDKRGVDVAIDFSGNVHAMQDCLKCVAYGGTVVSGAYPAPYGAGLDFGGEAHHHVPNLVFTRICSHPHREHPRWNEERFYVEGRRLIEAGRLTGKPLVDPIIDFAELPEQYPRIADEPETFLKLGVRF